MIDQELNSDFPADLATAIKNRVEDKEEDSRETQDSLFSDEEIAEQAHDFLGHALGRLLNENVLHEMMK